MEPLFALWDHNAIASVLGRSLSWLTLSLIYQTKSTFEHILFLSGILGIVYRHDTKQKGTCLNNPFWDGNGMLECPSVLPGYSIDDKLPVNNAQSAITFCLVPAYQRGNRNIWTLPLASVNYLR